MREAMFYEKLPGKAVRCGLCARRCTIPDGLVGFCRVRQNKGGKLSALNYGKVATVEINPIEKKPFFHFAPASKNISFSTLGCTFACDFCCNWEIAQGWSEIYGEDLSPEELVDMAKRYGVQGMSYTFTEPTVFAELAHDTAKLARKAGLYNCWVTNGYTTPDAIAELSKYLDAVVVDFKCSANKASYQKLSKVVDPRPIFDALLAYKKAKVWFEMSDLIIPGHGDDPADIKKLCRWIVDNLGPDVPLHFIQFFPAHKMLDTQPTPVAILERAHAIAKAEGLRYVYTGNVPGHRNESTFCPDCGTAIIRRFGLRITDFNLTKDLRCPNCKTKIPIAGAQWAPPVLWKANI